MFSEKIRIGTLVPAKNAAGYIRQILPHGFESFSITFGKHLGGVDLGKMAADTKRVLESSNAIVSSLSCFGNPLKGDADAAATIAGWEALIDNAGLFGCAMVTGFAGRVVDKPVAESMDAFAKVFGPLTRRAADHGVRLAFENCPMGGDWKRGDWNIAFNPDAWELMFNAVPADNLGLQWEPCHQMCQLIDPIAQLRKWVKKVFCLHGKDATVNWDVVRDRGISGPTRWIFHRTPGFGDCNWADIITILRQGGFANSIDIEGWHDPVYCDELEMTGQVAGLNYLKRCRGGTFVPNPVE